MAIMIENKDWIDEYEIETPHTEAEDWDADILNDPNHPFVLEEVKFDWKCGVLQPVQQRQ